jgi:hypothetical protein
MHVCNVLLVNKYLVKKKSHTQNTHKTPQKNIKKPKKERNKQTTKRLYIKDPARVDIKNKYM